MSYDVRFCIETVREDNHGNKFVVVKTPEYDSPTYNLRDMFRACMDWDYDQGEHYPMTDVLPKIERGIRELTENRAEYEKYNPENGWGDLDGALRCLVNWKAELLGGEYTRVGGSYHETEKVWEFECATYNWPLDALWWEW